MDSYHRGECKSAFGFHVRRKFQVVHNGENRYSDYDNFRSVAQIETWFRSMFMS